MKLLKPFLILANLGKKKLATKESIEKNIIIRKKIILVIKTSNKVYKLLLYKKRILNSIYAK